MKTVTDSSILISIFSDKDKFHELGLKVLLKITNKEIEPVMPTLAVPEVCGAMGRNFGFDIGIAIKRKLNSWINSNVFEVKELTTGRMISASEDAIVFGLRGGDAVFVSLAKELKVPLLTFDEEIKKKIKGKVKIFENIAT